MVNDEHSVTAGGLVVFHRHGRVSCRLLQLEAAGEVLVAEGTVHQAAGHVLSYVLLIDGLHDFAIHEFSELGLVQFLSAHNH